MADQWELICHHDYRGVPGVVGDRAPKHASAGMAIAPLAASDFLYDGVTPGSGSVRFYTPGAKVHVPIDKEKNAALWQPLIGVRGEVTFRREVHAAGAVPIDTLLDGDSFQFYVRGNTLVAWFSSYPTQYAEITSAFDPVGPQVYQVPTAAWTTVGFLHDGLTTLELYADGQVVARKQGVFAPVNSAGGAGLSIGNALRGDVVLHGEIDDVKIWRLNPRRMTDEFFSRPMDAETANCWERIRRELRAALARHPDCARELLPAFRDVVNRLHRQTLEQGAETRRRLAESQRMYQRLWREGRIDGPEMRKLFADLVAWASLVGIDPGSDLEFVTLLHSRCFRRILGEISLRECDPQAIALLRSIVEHVGGAGSTKLAGA
jgi:hypothetical protein